MRRRRSRRIGRPGLQGRSGDRGHGGQERGRRGDYKQRRARLGVRVDIGVRDVGAVAGRGCFIGVSVCGPGRQAGPPTLSRRSRCGPIPQSLQLPSSSVHRCYRTSLINEYSTWSSSPSRLFYRSCCSAASPRLGFDDRRKQAAGSGESVLFTFREPARRQRLYVIVFKALLYDWLGGCFHFHRRRRAPVCACCRAIAITGQGGNMLNSSRAFAQFLVVALPRRFRRWRPAQSSKWTSSVARGSTRAAARPTSAIPARATTRRSAGASTRARGRAVTTWTWPSAAGSHHPERPAEYQPVLHRDLHARQPAGVTELDHRDRSEDHLISTSTGRTSDSRTSSAISRTTRRRTFSILPVRRGQRQGVNINGCADSVMLSSSRLRTARRRRRALDVRSVGLSTDGGARIDNQFRRRSQRQQRRPVRDDSDA